jgi:hypothetical protein
MRVSGTIVRGISPRPGTTWDGRSSAPEPRAEPKRSEPSADESGSPPPDSGMGMIVDRKV